MSVVRYLNRLRRVVDAPSLVLFKARTGLSGATWSSGRCVCPWQGTWVSMIFTGSFQPKPFYYSMLSLSVTVA